MANQKNILIPTKNAESWKSLLANPEKHWQVGFSAKSAAESWEKANGLPTEIVCAFNQHENFKDSELLLAIPEFKVTLPGGNRSSQNDLLVVTTNNNGLTVITVEAKVNEDFSKLMKVWKKEASVGKKDRLTFLLETINFPKQEIDNLRYQLFHRLTSAVIMAKKFHANNALMIIQSFEENDAKNHFIDYQNFISAYQVVATKEQIQKLTSINDIDVYALWVLSK